MKFVVRARIPDMDYIAYVDLDDSVQGIGRNFAEAIGNLMVDLHNKKIRILKCIGDVQIKIIPVKQGSAIKAIKKSGKTDDK